MEKLNLPVYIPCPNHPSEVIQRVDAHVLAKKQLFCLDCALQSEDPKALLLTLQTLPNFLIAASNFYANNKNKIRPSSGPPQEFLHVLREKDQNLSNLSEHFDEEKRKIEESFNDIINYVIELVNQKKIEYFEMLDQQLTNMENHYSSYEKQLKKAYPTNEDVNYLFPSREELERRIGSLTTPAQLEYFVQDVKDDLNNEKFTQNLIEMEEQTKRAYFNGLMLNLKASESIKPTSGIESLDLDKIKTTLKQTVDKLLEKEHTLKNAIPDPVSLQNSHDSTVLRPEDFLLVREWLPAKYKPTLKLIYRGSKDGLNPQGFHSKCDGRGATITFIKCQFSQSSKISVIGGFIDKDWHQRGECIVSDEGFIFSVTAQVKCSITNKQFAAYGGPRNGPRFGNCDIQTYTTAQDGKLDQNLVRPSSYAKSGKIVESEKYKGSGEIMFKILDIEVYQVR